LHFFHRRRYNQLSRIKIKGRKYQTKGQDKTKHIKITLKNRTFGAGLGEFVDFSGSRRRRGFAV